MWCPCHQLDQCQNTHVQDDIIINLVIFYFMVYFNLNVLQTMFNSLSMDMRWIFQVLC
jgi:hypothetical protein